MSEINQEQEQALKQALDENGSFDPEKAATMKQQVVGYFGNKLRKVERITWIYLIVCSWVAIFAIRAYERSSSTKEAILFAIVFLVAFETTILVKLAFWIMNTKVSLTKEMKLLRLAVPNQIEPEQQYTSETLRSNLSRSEKRVWLGALVASALILPNVFLPAIGSYKAELICESYVTLEKDGSGTTITKMELHNRSNKPMMSTAFNAPAETEIQWLDSQGQEMPATAIMEGDRKQYTIALSKPIMPGEWLTYTRIMKSSSLVEKCKDGVWSYRFDEEYGHQENDFLVNVTLPENVQSVSLQTEGEMEHKYQQGRQVFVNGRRSCNHPFKFTVEYQLPNKAATEAKEKEEE